MFFQRLLVVGGRGTQTPFKACQSLSSRVTYGGLFPGLQEIAQAWPVSWGVPSVILISLPEKSSPEKVCVG